MDRSTITRRSVLGAVGASGALALAGCVSGDSGVEGEFSIGVLQDFSGQLSAYGQQGTAGFYSGLGYKSDSDPLGADAVDAGDYEYTVGDITLELNVRDTQSSPQTAQELAEELATSEEVDMLYGVIISGGAIRVINQVIDRAEIPFMAGPAASAAITANSENCRELVFRANENTAMDARSGGVYIAEATDVERVALFGADNAFGNSVVDNYRAVLENRGVDVVLERFVEPGESEWGGLLDQAENEGAQGLVGGFTAQTLIPFSSAFLQGDYDLRLFGGFASRLTLTPVGNLLSDLLGDDFTNEGLAQANFGPFTTRYHWNQYDNEINDAFVESHAEAYDVVPDLFTSGAFTAASAIIQGFEQAGEVSGDALVDELRGMTVSDTPKGSNAYTFQEYNNQARSPMTVAPVEVTEDEPDWPASIQPGDPLETISADDVTIPASEMSCDLS